MLETCAWLVRDFVLVLDSVSPGVMEDWSVGVLNLLVSRRMKSPAPASAEARMNLPGSTEGNWRWRCTDEMLSELVFEHLYGLTATTDRHP
jgi:hypothetical protein